MNVVIIFGYICFLISNSHADWTKGPGFFENRDTSQTVRRVRYYSSSEPYRDKYLEVEVLSRDEEGRQRLIHFLSERRIRSFDGTYEGGGPRGLVFRGWDRSEKVHYFLDQLDAFEGIPPRDKAWMATKLVSQHRSLARRRAVRRFFSDIWMSLGEAEPSRVYDDRPMRIRMVPSFRNPTHIALLPSQYERVNTCLTSDEEESECPVCLVMVREIAASENAVLRLRCPGSHLVCESCVQEAEERGYNWKNGCLMCRQPISSEDSSF